MPSSIQRLLPFAASTTPTQAATYLLGISLFSISFLVFLNSSVSFVITDLLGQKKDVGDVVGTLGFADEIVALVACPAWGLVSDRLGVRWVAVIGYTIVGSALLVFVQARNVYPQLLLARIFFAVGASATATMVTAILPSLTDEDEDLRNSALARAKAASRNRHSVARLSAAFSVESEATITPEVYSRSLSSDGRPVSAAVDPQARSGKSSVLAGYVGLFTGCGALLALSCFLPLPAKFGEVDKVTPGEAVSYSFYVVGAVALLVAVAVSFGLRGIQGEQGKGWRLLLGLKGPGGDPVDVDDPARPQSKVIIPKIYIKRKRDESQGSLTDNHPKVVPYLHLMKDSVLLGFTDSRIALGYLGGFVARASTVAISLFVPLYINTFFISNGFCQGSPSDPSPELKKECRQAYVLSSILTGVAQLMGLVCAPVFGYLSRRPGRVNYPVVVATIFGIVGYVVFPRLSSPEISDVDGRGGTPAIFLVVSLIGISQIGSIVCSLGSLGKGILAVEIPRTARRQHSIAPGEDESTESEPLIRIATEEEFVSRLRLKGSIAGVYSLCGGAAILVLTKLGGLLFDVVSNGTPFYMMAGFNAALLTATLLVDASQTFSRH
ncbi:major facilitator superfamily domain [Trichoderma cornu-damae]|uniref:Major facilitator superfamily domain n=1 Tax=Trichoderma cornu-damae TaxID=654480 RepID=A0A9P8TX09_9HYPO|nr:major facilitator superfamily domain [Trichoderma cornu-damae]